MKSDRGDKGQHLASGRQPQPTISALSDVNETRTDATGGGMNGKRGESGIEALEASSTRELAGPTKRSRKNRGMPPPATFDIDTLPGSSNLTALETAAIVRRTPGALEQWRRDPNHPLKWRHVDGRPLYRVDAVREYLASKVKRRHLAETH